LNIPRSGVDGCGDTNNALAFGGMSQTTLIGTTEK